MLLHEVFSLVYFPGGIGSLDATNSDLDWSTTPRRYRIIEGVRCFGTLFLTSEVYEAVMIASVWLLVFWGRWDYL